MPHHKQKGLNPNIILGSRFPNAEQHPPLNGRDVVFENMWGIWSRHGWNRKREGAIIPQMPTVASASGLIHVSVNLRVNQVRELGYRSETDGCRRTIALLKSATYSHSGHHYAGKQTEAKRLQHFQKTPPCSGNISVQQKNVVSMNQLRVK